MPDLSSCSPILVDPAARPVPPRGRPAPVGYELRSRTLLRRAELRDAGARIFARTGGEGALGEIALEVGLRPASITNFYSRKHDLTFDILHAHLDGLMEYVGGTEEAAANVAPFVRLTRMIQAYLDFVLAYRDEQHVALAMLDTLPAVQRDPMRSRIRLIAHRLGAALEAAVPGLADAAALRTPVSLNLMAMLNTAVLWFDDSGALPREDLALLLAHHAVAGAGAMLGRE